MLCSPTEKKNCQSPPLSPSTWWRPWKNSLPRYDELNRNFFLKFWKLTSFSIMMEPFTFYFKIICFELCVQLEFKWDVLYLKDFWVKIWSKYKNLVCECMYMCEYNEWETVCVRYVWVASYLIHIIFDNRLVIDCALWCALWLLTIHTPQKRFNFSQKWQNSTIIHSEFRSIFSADYCLFNIWIKFTKASELPF